LSLSGGLSGTKLKNILTKSATGYEVIADDLLKSIDKSAKYYATADLNTIVLGKRIGYGYISMGHGMKFSGNTEVQKEIATLLLKGNESFIGKEQNFQLSMQYQIMHQIYLGYAQQIGKVNLGIKLKYLNGISTLNTNKSSVSIFTADNSYASLVKNNLVINTTAPISLDSNFNIETPTIDFSKNFGYGFDLGMEYNINENASIMLSAIDLGKITWNDKVYNYVNNKESSIRGLNVKDLIDQKEVALEDTLTEIFKLTSQPSSSFTSTLSPIINVGGKYIKDKYTIAAMVSHQIFTYSNQTNISLMAMKDISNIFRLGLSYTYRDGGHHPGINLGLKLGPVKMYMSSQNALQPLGLRYLQTTQMTAGLSIEFGKVKIKEYEEY
jgi:hypothetical protein